MENEKILIYQTSDGRIDIAVTINQDTLWLNQYQLAELFQTDRTSVIKHIRNIYKSGELDEGATCAKIAQVRNEGGRKITRNITQYNLDVIISVGYRVNSKQGTQFRIWANNVLKDYLAKGYVLNEKRLQEKTQQFDALKQTVRFLSNVAESRPLTSDEITLKYEV